MDKPIKTVEIKPVEQQALGGAIEGAERTTRETMTWLPAMGSPDRLINGEKPLADSRSRDMVMNDGYAAGASNLYKDNIVGAQYLLNAKPDYTLLGADEGWAEEFQRIVEARFNTAAESEDCWLDASRRNTFTGLVRLAIGSFVLTGEVLGTAEWIRNEARRPFKTAIQLISPDRLSNPNGMADTQFIRRGIKRDVRGKPVSAFIRKAYPNDPYLSPDTLTWAEIDFEKPWGRKQVIHIIEQLMPDQTRGISDMVAVLKQMRMTKKFQEITLQNAVVNASYAAAIESELPSGEVFATLGANDPNGVVGGMQTYLASYMGSLGSYLEAAKNISIDGAKIPHLFPGTKLHMQPVGTPGGVGTGYEESLLRHIAAALNLSYEEFARDYSKTNYSSARASMNNTWKGMQAKKKAVADRFANNVYALWLEEELANGNIPLPAGKTREWFYEPLVKDALVKCAWIGASRGQIDETKETEAAIARIEAGLSTWEKECARLGEDFREVFKQRAREKRMQEELGLDFSRKSAAAPAQNNQQSNQQQDGQQGQQQGNQAATPVVVEVKMEQPAAQTPVSIQSTGELKLEKADVHLHQTIHNPPPAAPPRMRKVIERDAEGNMIGVIEVPYEE